MARPLSPSARNVLSQLARHGTYLWMPEGIALLNDSWHSRVHIGSVSSLLRMGLIAEIQGDALGLTQKGSETLKQLVENTAAIARFQDDEVVAEVMATGFHGTRNRLVSRLIADVLRVVSVQAPENWETLVDFAVAGKPYPGLVSIFEQVLDAVEPSDDEHFDIDVRWTALGPKRSRTQLTSHLELKRE